MDGRMRQLVVDPASFFDAASPSLSQSAGVPAALSAVCLGVIPPVLALLRSPVISDAAVFDAFPPIRYATAGWEVSLPGVVGVLVGTLIAEPIVAWIVFAALFYLLSWPIARERGFGRTVRLVAWGFAPQLVANVCVLAVLAVKFPATPTEIWGLGVTVPARIYAYPLESEPLFVAVNAVGVLCTLWSGYLWAHAVAAARGLTVRRGLAVVAVPTVLVLGPI
ncbi:YIP1 family protein [Natrinema sp. 74]|uniref:YIP1 family protein n=1 Tax=Natrinema sp. 74 TaxID=3384159 RepID=UPI0038D46F4D